MLTQLTVKNLAIVAQLELHFMAGMHVITGETGAGKSIIIDALSIVLGERASNEHIRAGQPQAEVTASFDISNLTVVQNLLQAQELPHEECVIRRIISTDGRSRAYINGCTVAVQQIKTISPYLVHIHSQHQHHALLESDYQRQLLDVYADHASLLHTVNLAYHEWLAIKQKIQQLNDIQQQADKLTLLNYQVQELESLNLQANELPMLEQQHTQLARAEELIATCQNISSIIANNTESDTAGILDQLHNAYAQLSNLLKITTALTPCADLIKQAIIQVAEANTELQNYVNKLELDPQQLVKVEQRLSDIHAIARKLRVTPESLLDHYSALCQQRNTLNQATEQLEKLQQQLQLVHSDYQNAAHKLTHSRQQAGERLAQEVIRRLKTLEMPNAMFTINLEPLKHNHPTACGNESIHFMVTTNPGQPLGLLKKVASGGELSRISLAIHVITAKHLATPTLILDEVDVGISGKTAATVGALMRELGANAQILCITHLAQVAAQAHYHFKVEKTQSKHETATKITPLSLAERAQELARLIGGMDMTPEALAHAERLLEAVVP